MGNYDLRQFTASQPLAEQAAADCLDLICGAGNALETFSLALSGGRIARAFCSTLATRVKERRARLSHAHFFWSDERCVPPDDPESNFRLANDLLLQPLEIGPAQIHRFDTEKPGDQCFARVETELRKLARFTPAGQPILDLVLLGLGEDGHVASLFPGEPEQVLDNPAVFRCVTAAKPPPRRVTMGYAAIAAAGNVWVLASGAGKAEALRESLRREGRTPLARVGRLRQCVRIYTDIA
jgi:6-phosphogluconolactonase